MLKRSLFGRPSPPPPETFSRAAQIRIDTTTLGRDCDALPKVRRAGQCFSEGGDRIQLMFNGIRVIENGYCDTWCKEIIRRLRGHHEPQEEFAFSRLLPHIRRNGSIVELGSWWSFYSLWFLKEVPGGRAILIEPDSIHLELGRRNFALNGRHGEFVHASIGRTPKPPRLFVSESANAEPMVPEISLDSLVRDKGIDKVDLLLADVQGAELEALLGAVDTIRAGKLRFAVISTHHHSISGDPIIHDRCLEFVRENGGVILAEHTIIESFSGDGLIVASFDHADCNLPRIEMSRNLARHNPVFAPLEQDLAEVLSAVQAVSESLAKAAEVNPDVQAAVLELRMLSPLIDQKWPKQVRAKAA